MVYVEMIESYLLITCMFYSCFIVLMYLWSLFVFIFGFLDVERYNSFSAVNVSIQPYVCLCLLYYAYPL